MARNPSVWLTMKDSLYRLARRLYPRLDALPEPDRASAAGYLLRALAFLPLAAGGLAGLLALTDLAALRARWPLLLILLAFLIVLSQLWLEMTFATVSGGTRSERRSFWGEALWSGVLAFGPAAAWAGAILPWLVTLPPMPGAGPLRRLRLLSQGMFRTALLLPTLLEIALYRRLGGTFPLPGLSLEAVRPAVWATLAGFSLGSLMVALSTGINRLMSPLSSSLPGEDPVRSRFFRLVLFTGPLLGLVAILPGGLYALAGPGAYFAFLALLTGGAFMADRLSRAAESARLRNRELAVLERLSQSIIGSPPDRASLPDLLAQHIGALFPQCQTAIRVEPDSPLITHPAGWPGPDPALWGWQPDRAAPQVFRPGQPRPWPEDVHAGTLVVPILPGEDGGPAGRLVLRRAERGAAIDRLLPAAQSLAGQIASARHSAAIYRQTLAERVAREQADRELALGARIQTGFLPAEIPPVEGWEIAAALDPARETSGDFYDFIALGDGRLGVVVADVADKGLGAAFYMAQTCTLLRTYAADAAIRSPRGYVRQLPDVLRRVSDRLIADTSGDTFVTLFYGILDPHRSVLAYVNAGHNPPLVFRRDRRRRARSLRRTGLPLAALEGSRWTRRSAYVEAGGVIVLYTDGLTEAENSAREPFGERRLEQVVRDNPGQSAQHLCDAILSAVVDFSDDAPRRDDITLVVLRRSPERRRP